CPHLRPTARVPLIRAAACSAPSLCFFFLMIPPPPRSTLFPYTTLFRSTYSEVYPHITRDADGMRQLFRQFSFPGGIHSHVAPETDRKSTRLNSSHQIISYAVFCLKKKKKKTKRPQKKRSDMTSQLSTIM